MSEYLRIVSYISEYIDGAKGKSCGFARIESPGNGGKIYVNIHTNKQFVDGNVIVAMYKEANGTLHRIHIGNADISKGNVQCTLQMDVNNVGQSGFGVKEMSGLYVYGESLNVLFISEWEEKSVNVQELIRPENTLENPVGEKLSDEGTQEDIASEGATQEDTASKETMQKDTVFGDGTQGDDTSEETLQNDTLEIEEVKEMPQQEEYNSGRGNRRNDTGSKRNFFEELSKCCVKIPPFGKVSRCLYIKPCDFVHFPSKYQNLAGNSFLLGGYIRHKFLIVGCWEYEGMTKYILGVPGSNVERERILADMFGFSTYVDAGGGLGYWCTFIDD